MRDRNQQMTAGDSPLRTRYVANSVICVVARPQTAGNRLRMKSVFVLCAVGSVTLVALVGCSSGGCPNTAPCGGDIVGTWKATSSCGSSTRSALSGACPAATALVGIFVNRSTVSYRADLTYSFAGDVSGEVDVSVPTECLASGQTCADVEQQLSTEPDFASIDCLTRESGCDCHRHQAREEVMEAGTFSVTADGLLTEVRAGAPPRLMDYCVRGNTLTLSPHQDSAAVGQHATSGTLNFMRMDPPPSG